MRFKDHDPSQGQIPAELLSQNKHESYFRTYFQWLDETNPDDASERQVLIVAKSPASPVILAMQALSEEFSSREIGIKIVFADVDPERALQSAWEVISELSNGRDHSDLLKWASSPGILEAHEQMILGTQMWWLGDAMRREPGRRDGFDLFEVDAPENSARALKSFEAIWNFATSLPGWMLREAQERRSSASMAGPDARALATLSFFRQLEKRDTHYH